MSNSQYNDGSPIPLWWPVWTRWDKFQQIVGNPVQLENAAEILADFQPEKRVISDGIDVTVDVMKAYLQEQAASPNLWIDGQGQEWIMFMSDWECNMLGHNTNKKNDTAWVASIKSRFNVLNPVIMPDLPVDNIKAYAATQGLTQVEGVTE